MHVLDVCRSVVELNAYLGPKRELEIWLLDENANPLKPIQLIGRVNVSVVGEAMISAKSGLVLRFDLTGGFSGADGTIAEPQASLVDSATWDELFADPSRYESVTGEVLEDEPSTAGETTP